MVDVISTRLQEVYGSIRIPDFIGLGNNEPEERMTTAQMRRFGDENRRRKLQDKAKERKVGFVTLNIINMLLNRINILLNRITTT